MTTAKEQTEKLRERLAKRLYEFRTRGTLTAWFEWEKLATPVQQPYYQEADQILSACKEAGLKFVPDDLGLPLWLVKRLEQGESLKVLNTIDTQIKEIEL